MVGFGNAAGVPLFDFIPTCMPSARNFPGQYDHPLRVVAFNPLEGWSRDASEDVAHELEQRVEGHEVTESVREFIERFTGRPIGVQLMLPLRGSELATTSAGSDIVADVVRYAQVLLGY